MKVITQERLVTGSDEIYVSVSGAGTASTVSMSDDEMKAAAARERVPFGFQAPARPPRHKRRA